MSRYNIAADLLDRHLLKGRGDNAALIFEDSGGFSARFSYRDLTALANRFAFVLRGLGVVRGDRVLFRVPNHPAFYYGALGCARIGAVFVPTSTLFKDREVLYRLEDSGAVVAVTTAGLSGAIEAARGAAGDLREVLCVDDMGEPPLRGHIAKGSLRSLSRAMAAAQDHVPGADTEQDDPAFLAYSSGTTGDPKGILHLQQYARSYDYLIREWHAYRDGDVVACPAEIGWMLPVASTFLYALRAGVTVLLYREREPAFRPERWCELIARHRVTNFVGTPTIYRMLLTVGSAESRFDLSCLRHGTSAGEPLPAPTFVEVHRRFGFPPLDGIGMSECMVYAHNRASEEIVPGSCGRAGSGLELAVLDESMQPVSDGNEGVLCVRRRSHLGLMREYWKKPEATAEVFRGEWYWSGDVVRRDPGGRFTFLARADDVMKCSGYRISPFEVESALQSHPLVLEAAAVEWPDELRGNVIKSFVTLREPAAGNPALAAALAAHVKSQLAPFKAPKHVEFVAALPKTQSGKIKRRELRDSGHPHRTGQGSTAADPPR